MTTVAAIPASELRELYRELILDHARKPRHFGPLADATHTAEGINPLCGDKLRLYVKLEDDEIRDATFEGSGCAISLASASLLTDTVIGMQPAEALRWSGQINARLAGKRADTDFDPGKLRALEGVREFPSRVKCATLAWHALQAAIECSPAPATTEQACSDT